MLNRLKQGLTMYPGAEKTPDDGLRAQLREFSQGDEIWAEVIAVGGKKRGWTRVELEIHHEHLTYPNETYTQIPKGESLAPGDHVAIVPLKQTTRSEAQWLPGKAVKEEAKDEAAFELLPGWMPVGPRGLTAPIPRNGKWADWKINWGAKPQYGRKGPSQEEMRQAALEKVDMPDQAAELERLRAAGALSDTEAEQTAAHLAGTTSVEEMHASGAMSDANYAQAQRVRQEALDRMRALRDSGALTEEQYQATIAGLG